MLAEVVDLLSCPFCRSSVVRRASALVCAQGHAFDVARQGYASMLAGDAHLGSADTPAMVAARERFLAAGHFERLAAALADAAADAAGAAIAADAAGAAAVATATGPGHSRGAVIVDVGAGTGYYLDRVLERLPAARGVALDLSKHSARRAARVSRAGAVVCDVWRGLPLGDGVATVVTNVFAPRNAAEMARVLAPGGALVVVTPEPGHLHEAIESLGLLRVDAAKDDRLEASLGTHFERAAAVTLSETVELDAGALADLAAMGPSAHHVSPDEIRRRTERIREPLAVSVVARISTYRPR